MNKDQFRSIDELESWLRNLESDIGSDNVVEALYFLLHSNSSAGSFRTAAIVEGGPSAVTEALTRVDRIAAGSGLAIPAISNHIYFGNLAYFSPSVFLSQLQYFVERLEYVGYLESCLMLQHSAVYSALRSRISENPSLRLSPTFAVLLALRASAEGEDDPKLLSLLIDRMVRITGYVPARGALSKRLSSRSKTFNALEAGESKRTALFITGQFRNVDACLKQIPRHFDLSSMDVYVSSWSNPGRTAINRARLSRRLHPEVQKWARENLSDEDLERVDSYERAQLVDSTGSLTAKIVSSLGAARKVEVNLTDDRELVYGLFDNHWKMHFHNLYWPQKLGHDYFRNEYDLIIKTRPDLKLSQSDRIVPENLDMVPGAVANDHGSWLFEIWGFGMGDQLIYGQPDLMLPTLDVSHPSSLSTRLLTETFGKGILVQGHISVGIEAWLAGGDAVQAPVTKRGLLADDKLSTEEFLALARSAGVRSTY